MEVDEVYPPTERIEGVQLRRMPVCIVCQRVGLGGSEAGAECGQPVGRPVHAAAERLSQRPVSREQIVARQFGELIEDVVLRQIMPFSLQRQ